MSDRPEFCTCGTWTTVGRESFQTEEPARAYMVRNWQGKPGILTQLERLDRDRYRVRIAYTSGACPGCNLPGTLR